MVGWTERLNAPESESVAVDVSGCCLTEPEPDPVQVGLPPGGGAGQAAELGGAEETPEPPVAVSQCPICSFPFYSETSEEERTAHVNGCLPAPPVSG